MFYAEVVPCDPPFSSHLTNMTLAHLELNHIYTISYVGERSLNMKGKQVNIFFPASNTK
jgi:hypothetical protein